MPLFFVQKFMIFVRNLKKLRFFAFFFEKIWWYEIFVVPLHPKSERDVLKVCRPKRNGQRWGATRRNRTAKAL